MSDGRSAHKADTRQALIDAALELFAANGYEATSTAEIAVAAGVSPRTFFRYFETKERVLFFGGDAFNQAVIRELPGQPPQRSHFDALAATMLQLAPLAEPLRRRIALYFSAVDASPVLLGQHARAGADHAAAIATALATRGRLRRPDDTCVVAAQLAEIAAERAYRAWATSGSRRLAPVMRESFELVRSVARS